MSLQEVCCAHRTESRSYRSTSSPPTARAMRALSTSGGSGAASVARASVAVASGVEAEDDRAGVEEEEEEEEEENDDDENDDDDDEDDDEDEVSDMAVKQLQSHCSARRSSPISWYSVSDLKPNRCTADVSICAATVRETSPS